MPGQKPRLLCQEDYDDIPRWLGSLNELRPVLEPPITRRTLNELDIDKIVNNPKLRHDINFDPDLHFRPRIDEDTLRKLQRARQAVTARWSTEGNLEATQAKRRDYHEKPLTYHRPAVSLKPKPRENRRKVLRIRVNRNEHLACPDSGSDRNIISLDCAKKNHFVMRKRRKDMRQFELGNGTHVSSLGRVLIHVEIPGYSMGRKKRWFYVLEKCPVPFVLGIGFLREAEILTKNRNFLESCPPDYNEVSSLLWIGSPRNRLKCTIDGRQLKAVADTGSDLNLMSLACAEREGFQIDRRREARSQIMVGDGTVLETVGQVYVSTLSLDWRSPETELSYTAQPMPFAECLRSDSSANISIKEPEADEFDMTFHVLSGLPSDIVLGQNILHSTDAFNHCPDLLNTGRPNMGKASKFQIFISLGRRKRVIAVDPVEKHNSERHAEFYRRSNNTEASTALLPPNEREAAREIEEKNVQDWDKAHANCCLCHPMTTTRSS